MATKSRSVLSKKSENKKKFENLNLLFDQVKMDIDYAKKNFE